MRLQSQRNGCRCEAAGNFQRHRLCWQCTCNRRSAGLVQGVCRIDTKAQFAHTLPFRSAAVSHRVGIIGQALKALDIAPLGIDFEQLLMNGNAPRIGFQRLFQYFLSLQVAAIGQIHIGFSDGINIVRRVQLAGRVDH